MYNHIMLAKGKHLDWYSLYRDEDKLSLVCRVRSVDFVHALLNLKRRASVIASTLGTVDALRVRYCVLDADMHTIWQGTLQALMRYRFE